MPPTPKARETNFWDSGRVSVSHPSPYSDFSSRVLNASALSFTPTSTTSAKIQYPHSFNSSPLPSPAPVYTDFVFPSLNPIPSRQSLCLKKDEQGFYTEVKSSSGGTPNNRTAYRSSSSSQPIVLPHNFRGDRVRKVSRTRKIVDQIRSASVSNFDGDRPLSRGTVPPRPVSTPHQILLAGNSLGSKDSADALEPVGPQSSLCSDTAAAVVGLEDESDGWVRSNKDEGETKAQRTRELVQALGRKRSDSNNQEGESDTNHPEEEGDWELAQASTSSIKNSSSTLETTPTRRKGSRHRSRKSQGRSTPSSTSASVTPAPSMPLPAPPLPFFNAAHYPLYPPPYPYVSAPPNIPFKPMAGSISPMQPWYPTYRSPPFGVPMPLQPGIPVHGAIASGSGIRHAQW